MELLNDEKIMLSVKSGEIELLAMLFEKYHTKIFNFFVRMTRNRDISQDLTQDVFQRILKYRLSYDSRYEFRTWMYQIARNVLNKHYSENKLLISDFDAAEDSILEDDIAFEESENSYKRKILYEALSHLNKEQREIIELARFQGLRYKEISELTNNSVAAIKVKVHRAINKLRELYFELV